MILWICEIWGNFLKIIYFVSNCLTLNLKILLHMCDSYHCDYFVIHHIPFLIDFQLKYGFPFPILRFFIVKSPSITLRLVSQENAFKKSKNLSLFFSPAKLIGSNNSFTLIENNFRFFKIAKFEFKVTVHHGVWAKCTQMWPLKNRRMPAKDLELSITCVIYGIHIFLFHWLVKSASCDQK